ncbi:MAG: hypothetical protein BWZ10_01878 [candidate division BRC1 bacterium ADurb.BinA364]|nr:MAG: hypothetical protein BWZ10_01878 [candidate division BRC1 bacterium ADurb.BinA364]
MNPIRAGLAGLALAIAVCAAGKDEKSQIYQWLYDFSYPGDPAKVSLTNPWGENLPQIVGYLPDDMGLRISIAAEVYANQKVRFDGYFGSDDDGMHYAAAADGLDNAYYGDQDSKTYRLVRNKKIDDLTERVWVCPDMPVHAVSLAGFPLREAMIQDWERAPNEYMANGYFPQNRPVSHWYFRRVLNLRRYLTRAQAYWNDEITIEQYEDPAFRPQNPFEVGDIVLFGHYGDEDNLSHWSPKHSGIVGSVDKRGLPVKIWNMRVSHKLDDTYTGVIDQTRPIGDKKKYFRRFCDRYSLSGHGRIVNAYVPSPESAPKPEFDLAPEPAGYDFESNVVRLDGMSQDQVSQAPGQPTRTIIREN